MAEYDKQCGAYLEFTLSIEKLIKDLLQESNIRVHSVTSRLKAKPSIEKKLEKTGKHYSKLDEITDISGLRIITYFEEDVQAVAKMIEQEFNVNQQLSVNKQDLLDPDRFGYVSIHYIAKLTESRSKLTEYKRFASCQCEIQIRSILQHAWAEIEHDLGYKSKLAVPKQIQRRFSRLAGLLEIADVEFNQIRLNIEKYEKEVPSQIIKSPDAVLINQASLQSLINSSEIIGKMDEKIATTSKNKLHHTIDDTDELLQRFQYVGYGTIAQIDSTLRSEDQAIIRFAERWLKFYGKTGGYFKKGISLFYLSLYLIGKKGDYNKAIDYFKMFRMFESKNIEKGAQNLIEFTNSTS